MNARTLRPFSAARGVRGYGLIELMLALVIGLLVVLAAGAVFVSHSRTFKATQALAAVQEKSRVAFETMARDLRESGGNPCDASKPPSLHVRTDADAAAFWQAWSEGLHGFDGQEPFTTPSQAFGDLEGMRVAGTDAVSAKSATALESSVTTDMAGAEGDLSVDDTSRIASDDTLMVCDHELAAIFRPTALTPTTIAHGISANCIASFTAAEACGGTLPPSGTRHIFGPGAQIAVPAVARWFVGHNGRGGTSLYRGLVRNGKTDKPAEIAEGVNDMKISYLVDGADRYTPGAAGVAGRWDQVRAVQIALTFGSAPDVLVDGAPLTRHMKQVVYLRNREP